MEVSRCPGRGQLRDSWEGCDFYIVWDFYPLSLFTLLVRYLSILVSVRLLCKVVGGFEYKLYQEPCPFWCGADSQYLLLLSSGCCIKKKRCRITDFSLFFSDPLSLASTSAVSLQLPCSWKVLQGWLLCWKTAICSALTQAHSSVPTFWLSIHLPATPDS